MDIGTLLGIIFGSGIIIAAIAMGGGGGFFDVPSLLITIGGALSATLINFPLPKIIRTMGVVRKAFMSRDKDYLAVFNRLSDFAVRARRDGILGLESDVETLDDLDSTARDFRRAHGALMHNLALDAGTYRTGPVEVMYGEHYASRQAPAHDLGQGRYNIRRPAVRGGRSGNYGVRLGAPRAG